MEKVIIITGSDRSIGAETARKVAEKATQCALTIIPTPRPPRLLLAILQTKAGAPSPLKLMF
jgi:NAD(P)-dependent dehydrogenase (short-subunit alcohol dehydrogenase family)